MKTKNYRQIAAVGLILLVGFCGMRMTWDGVAPGRQYGEWT